MVCRILIQDATFQLEARRRHIRDDPLSVPDWIRILAHGGCSENQRGILLMPLGQFEHQLRNDIRIRGKRAEIRKGQIVAAMEGESQRVSGWRMGDGGVVEPSSRLVMIMGRFIRCRILHGDCLIMKFLGLVNQLGTEFVASSRGTRLGTGGVHGVEAAVILLLLPATAAGAAEREGEQNMDWKSKG